MLCNSWLGQQAGQFWGAGKTHVVLGPSCNYYSQGRKCMTNENYSYCIALQILIGYAMQCVPNDGWASRICDLTASLMHVVPAMCI